MRTPTGARFSAAETRHVSVGSPAPLFGTGVDEPMRVVFREVDQWNLWIWAQVRSNLLEEERDTLAEVLKAWFILGKLGGFSSSNVQVQRHADKALGVSAMPYRIEERDAQACGFHAMGDPEFKGNWMRCWCAGVFWLAPLI